MNPKQKAKFEDAMSRGEAFLREHPQIGPVVLRLVLELDGLVPRFTAAVAKLRKEGEHEAADRIENILGQAGFTVSVLQ